MKRHFDFSHMTQELPIVLCCLLSLLPLPWLPCVNSFGILNQLEKTGRMWGFLSDCELPPTKKKKRDIRKMGRNRTEITKKKAKDHKHFKRVGRKARETIAQNPLKAHSSFL